MSQVDNSMSLGIVQTTDEGQQGGSGNVLLPDTIYQAGSDGFLSVVVAAPAAARYEARVVVGSTTPPGISTQKVELNNSTLAYGSMSSVVKRGEFWKVWKEHSSLAVTIYWRPF